MVFPRHRRKSVPRKAPPCKRKEQQVRLIHAEDAAEPKEALRAPELHGWNKRFTTRRERRHDDKRRKRKSMKYIER